MSGSPYTNIPIPLGSKTTIGSSTNSIEPIRRSTQLSEEIRLMEDAIEMYKEEFILIREQIFAIRSVLGMERPRDGTTMKLSSALKELAVEIDKRADIFGNIDPTIRL